MSHFKGYQRGVCVFTAPTVDEAKHLSIHHAPAGSVILHRRVKGGWELVTTIPKGATDFVYPAPPGNKRRGFASMTPERRAEVSAKGVEARK